MEQNLYICYNKIKVMDLRISQLELIEMLLKTKKESVLNKVRILLEAEQPKRISLEQYNKEIDEAVKDIENGEYYTQEEARKIASQW